MSSSQSQATGPTRIGSLVHGSSKSTNLVTASKATLSEQAQRLSSKHSSELELIDDVRTFLKGKCSMEKDYCSALSKLCTNHLAKKYPQFEAEKDAEIKSIFTVWQTYLVEEEKAAKFRASQYEQIAQLYDAMKQSRSHKVHSGKKGLDSYLKKMQEELLTSVTEIDKTRKFYFDEEHMARQARDKEEKIKKRKGGIFSKFTDLQSKKEKTSAHREASDIQSTMARNEYILALAAGNAHFDHYHNIDLPNLMQFIEDGALEKCKGLMTSLFESESSSLTFCYEALAKTVQALQTTSAEHTDDLFLSDPASACLRNTLQFEFDPCDGDTIRTVSIDHNAENALQHEITKWMTCFTKECRNYHRLNQQLSKCLNLKAAGKKTIEVTGVGMVEIESRIDDVKQQLRKCEISKAKAEARLLSIKESGMPIEDLELVESQISNEMRQTSLDVEAPEALSRTPSLRSTAISDGRVSASENKSGSDEQTESISQEPTPEPKQLSDAEAPESPVEKEAPSYQYESYDPVASWNVYDASAAWGDSDQTETVPGETVAISEELDAENNLQSTEYNDQEYQVSADGYQLVNKQVQALYDYEGQSEGELSFMTGQLLIVISAESADWVTARNENGETGFVPAAFVQVIGDAPVLSSMEPVTSYGDYENPVEERVQIEIVTTEEAIPQTHIEVTDTGSYVKALYDYTAISVEEISFREGEVFKVLERSDDGWWLGEKDGIIGHFPSMLVVDEDHETSEQAFEESSDSPSDESIGDVPSPMGAPPPTFAPPKPAYLTPHQVVITQPTPEVESRGTFGSEEPPYEAPPDAVSPLQDESCDANNNKNDGDSNDYFVYSEKDGEPDPYTLQRESFPPEDIVDQSREQERIEQVTPPNEYSDNEAEEESESPDTVVIEPLKDLPPPPVEKNDSLEDVEPNQLDEMNLR